ALLKVNVPGEKSKSLATVTATVSNIRVLPENEATDPIVSALRPLLPCRVRRNAPPIGPNTTGEAAAMMLMVNGSCTLTPPNPIVRPDVVLFNSPHVRDSAGQGTRERTSGDVGGTRIHTENQKCWDHPHHH